ncbi:MAG: hypothetical protein ACI4M9_03170, partial [Succinivibrio sp.]
RCDGYVKVDSKVDPNKKDIQCCGEEDCHLKECDNQVTTDTVSGSVNVPCCGEKNCYAVHCDGKTVVQTIDDEGLVPCCGVADCDLKACGSHTSVKLPTGNTVACCGKDDCEEKSCSLAGFWKKFGAIRITKDVWGVMGTMSGIVCSAYNPQYRCEVLDKQGNVVKSCSASDPMGGVTFNGYLNPCGILPIDSQIGIDHSPQLNISIPVSDSCTISTSVQLPNRHYFCTTFPIGGGCPYPTETFTFGKENTF